MFIDREMRLTFRCQVLGLLVPMSFIIYFLSRPDKVLVTIAVPITMSQMSNTTWLQTGYCNVNCRTGKPCEYNDEVDFRIIVMTFNRSSALTKTLEAITLLDTLNDRISIDIWIDRGVDGTIDKVINETAYRFKGIFTNKLLKGRVCVHHQDSNVNIRGQWIDTWRPKVNTKEICLLLEDDISISPMAYKWLKTVHRKYGSYRNKHTSNIAGYTLQMENIHFFSGKNGIMHGPNNHQVFLYPVLGTWGYSPDPNSWREFQDWYKEVRPDRNISTDKIEPLIDKMLTTNWYLSFIARHEEESMWEIWHIKYAEIKRKFTVYSNLIDYTKRRNVLLSNNRMERGLHFTGSDIADRKHMLLRQWDKSFENLPDFETLVKFNYDGKICTKQCCFSTKCI